MNWKEKIKLKIEDFKDKSARGAAKVVRFYENNREVVIVVGPCLIGAVVKLIKMATTRKKINDEQAHRERTIYDRKNGHYFYLRRKPNPYEWAEIDRRRDFGEPLYDILMSMRLL